MRVADIKSIRIKLASPEDILRWSHGEVLKPETINYRTQRPEKDGLFCERIFGPTKDYECYCGKYKRIRYKGVICDRCGVEVTKALSRRERMGHIKLAMACSHIWFLRGVPSTIGAILDIPVSQLEKIIYFSAYVITDVNLDIKKKILEEIEKEYKRKNKALRSLDQDESKQKNLKNKKAKAKTESEKLKKAKNRAREEVLSLKPLKILSENEYHDLSLKYGAVFEVGTGAETLRKLCTKIDLEKEIAKLKNDKEKTQSPRSSRDDYTEQFLLDKNYLTEQAPLDKNYLTGQVLAKRKILERIKLFQGMLKAEIRPEWVFLTLLPVSPPDLRPMVQLDGGRYASSDLNDLYRRVINRNNRLKYLLEIEAPEVILRNEKRMLQEAVDALIDNEARKGTMTTATTGGKRMLKSLADILKGKQGRFRQNLLGKRVDYSGRSVIVVGPELKLNQVGLPKKMALELFKPFIIKKILEKELAYNVRSASKLIEEGIDEVWAILEEITKDKVVLLNRAPTLHRLGIQAFYPVLIEGEAIKIHPMVCKAFNADFDGDQMAVHLPLSTIAQKEAREIMLSTANFLKPATGIPVITFHQDIALGCYYLTKIEDEALKPEKFFTSPEEAMLAYEFGEIDLKTKIKTRLSRQNVKPLKRTDLIETSVGRIIFNQALPSNYPFQNSEIKIKDLERISRETIEKYPLEKTQDLLNKIKLLGFEYASLSGISWGMDDLIIPLEKTKIIKEAEKEVEEIEGHLKKGFLSREEKTIKVIKIWNKAKSKIEELIPKTLPKNGPIYQIIESGAKGSWGPSVQMAGMKGLVINPTGQIIEMPIKNSFKQGFDVLEYFISTHGTRKGLADTALRTAAAGYLTRRLIDVAHEIIITTKDCGNKQGIIVQRKDADEIGQNFIHKISGRISLENIKGVCKKGEIIDWEKADKIVSLNIKEIKIASPLTCEVVKGLCQKCYGWDMGKNKIIEIGQAAGIVAAQSIGEPGTQLTMRTFHSGGVAGESDITLGLPRVQEIFEARIPKGKAKISQVRGKIIEITPERVIKIKQKRKKLLSETKKNWRTTKSLSSILEYKIPENIAILVEPNQEIEIGQQLCEGNLDLKELFKLVGLEQTQKYIIKEVQKIYVSQGVSLHDKHIETICRQMFSRLKIVVSEDSIFKLGEIVEKAEFLRENIQLKKEKKKPAKGIVLLLGISKVALTTESFLSAASFQETSRVLINASLRGKEDKLHGLKENVIIGKLIPAGTGFTPLNS